MGTSRLVREAVASELAAAHGGVVHRRDLRRHGVDEDDVRSELRAGRWCSGGRHTVVVHGHLPTGSGLWWRAVWESGSGAVLDGVTALQAQGLTGFDSDTLHICVPRESQARPVPGVTPHRRRDLGPTMGAGVPRTRPEQATIHAARWAVTDRQAALLVCLPVQQRLVHPGRLLDVWRGMGRGPRRTLLDQVVADVCDGAHSLGELDFARWCRRYGLPEPDRQSVRHGAGGRIYLDVEWWRHELVVEIDGAGHGRGLMALDDALRANEVTLTHGRVLRTPVLGLRLAPDQFMGQVARGLAGVDCGRPGHAVVVRSDDNRMTHPVGRLRG